MKIAITAQAPALDAPVDPRFGRCAYFLVIDSQTGAFEAVENSNRGGASGVGIQSGKLMADHGVEIVLTGDCGPNAQRTLEQAGIRIVTGCTGTVAEALQAFKAEATGTAVGDVEQDLVHRQAHP